MKTSYYSLFFLVSILLLTSCGSKKKTTTRPPAQTQEPNKSEKSNVYDRVGKINTPPRNLNLTESYIYQYKDIAKQEMRLFGIPASITLAQGILESGNGQGNLTSRSNNHFGIKCNGWQGAKVYHDDDEDQECFRKYSHAEYSYRDHSLFLFNRSRYRFLFDYKITDYKAWAKGLRKAGYATDPKYPDKLIGLIERYDLYKYDKDIAEELNQNPSSRKGIANSRSSTSPNKKTSNPSTYKVQKGDTLYSISNKHGIEISELIRLNNIQDNLISIGQILKLK